MHRALVILMLSLGGVSAIDGHWTMGTNTPLWGQSWYYYNASDAPEGAWRAISDAGGDIVQGNVTNSFTLAAGTNWFLLKAISYNGSNNVWIIVGANSNLVYLNSSDYNKYWTTLTPVLVDNPTNVYHLKPFTSELSGPATKVILRGVYVTTNKWENVYAEANTGYDYIIDYEYDTNVYTATPSGNLLEDGGFDTGIGHGWGLYPNALVRDASIASMWDTNDFHDGHGSFHIPDEELMHWGVRHLTTYKVGLESKPFKLRPNRQHTISMWTKGPSTDSGLLVIRNPIDVPAGLGYSNSFYAQATITANAAWHRTSITTNFITFPSDDFQITITVPTNTWIDSIQVEEGGLTAFSPTPLSMTVYTGRTGNLFSSDENVVLPINLWSTTNGTVQIAYSVFDWLNINVKTGLVVVPVTANTFVSTNLTPAINRNGTFRLVLRSGAVAEEVLLNIIPPFTASQTNLYAATHATHAMHQMLPLYKSGIRDTRVMSAAQLFNWSVIEANNNTFNYLDGEVAKFKTNNIHMMATLYENPSWMPMTTLTNDTTEWRQFVTNVVTHYAADVDTWEIWNEPLYVMNQSGYTNIYITAAQAIRALDPTAKIVFLGGVYDSAWAKIALNYMGELTNLIDVIDTHMYPTDVDPSGGDTENRSYTWYTNIMVNYPTIPTWNTEAGIFDFGMSEFNANFLATGYPLWPQLDSTRFQNGSHFYPELNLKNALHCFGWGQKKYFYYDSRTTGAHPGYFKNHTTSWDYDDSIKPKMTLLSVLNYLIGDATGIGKITNATATCYEFVQDTNSWITLWSSNQLQKSITIATNKLIVYDSMGNEIRTVTNGNNQIFTFGRKPIYVKAAGVATNVLRTLMTEATISSIADTNAPNLTIDVGPHVAGAVTATYRWIAIDDVDIPSASTPEAILYSTKLNNEAWTVWDAGILRTVALTPSSTSFSVAAKDTSGNATTNVILFAGAQSASASTKVKGKVKFNNAKIK